MAVSPTNSQHVSYSRVLTAYKVEVEKVKLAKRLHLPRKKQRKVEQKAHKVVVRLRDAASVMGSNHKGTVYEKHY